MPKDDHPGNDPSENNDSDSGVNISSGDISQKRLLKALIATIAVVTIVTHSGCALLGWEDHETLDLEDPVVQAGLSLRRGPASSDWNPVARARINGEVVPGMQMKDVRQVLGEPLEVETAGDATSGNQRWVYSDRYRGQLGGGPSRVLYFEDGRVAGWRNY